MQTSSTPSAIKFDQSIVEHFEYLKSKFVQLILKPL